ncbi:metallophosphoesterase family protein [Cellvibrio sp. OA-2007]|uniref:metallophosphoesterase family protein n=1 Tax=Cellvibrio sp. OA-2007 TaxID=529823 RepID=UPI0007863FC3|nr:metallophosphoesterase [Cellvibrio sp. OA-2007]
MDSKITHIKIAVCSDLHFIDEAKAGTTKPSWLTLKPCGGFSSSLWDDLLRLIEKEQISADLLLCPGDITTYADKTGLVKAWNCLTELGQKLEAQVVACATGNHDVCSREVKYKTSLEALNNPTDYFENLKQLSPPYPVFYPRNKKIPHSERVHYFGADYLFIDEFEHFRLVVFNSCARHTSNSDDYQRGRAAESAINWLKEELKNCSSDPKINIFLCHHHPILHTQNQGNDFDFMAKGDQLLAALNEHGAWLIIHGHKHEGRIVYAQSNRGTRCPIVFSAGTLSAHIKLGKGFRNQFYILDVELHQRPFSLKGKINVWNWTEMNSFKKADSRLDGLFSDTGFGEKDTYKVAQEITEIIKEEYFCNWESIKTKVPRVCNITPQDLDELCDYLSDLGVAMEYDENEKITMLSLKSEAYDE